MLYTRRDATKLALAAIPAANLWAAFSSKYAGVQIGVITPYSFHNMPNDAQSVLKDMAGLGINATEIQNPPVEEWAGAPAQPAMGRGPGGPAGARGPAGRGGGRGRGPLTPEQIAAAEQLKKWRLSVSMDKFKAFRKMYEDGGVKIYGFKLGLTEAMSDDEYQYTFNVVKALGANQLTMELPESAALTKRIGEFAAREKVMVGYHAHTQATPELWDVAMSQSKYNGINLDIGHYTAGTNSSPIPLIKKNHARITSMHLKDRKYEKNGGQNMPWGQGDTPLKEALQLMKKEKYRFPATIELEYDPPAGSDSYKEVEKCLRFCKDALA